MKITKELLEEKGACVDGYRAFLEEYPEKKFPDGVEYQELLDVCAEKNWEYGVWLLTKFGPTNEIREIKGDLIAEKSIIFAGQIKVSGGIKAGRYIEAGGGIKAGGQIETGEGIEAGRYIKAGEGIEAGRYIKAGEGIKAGWGIKAGFGIEAGRGIKAGLGIKAGWGIEAGLGIKTGGGIETGYGIKAGGQIETGEEFGIYAGLCCKITNHKFRKIIAAERPENIMCGEFEEKKA